MLNTPNYNIPYPESSDAPDGANQMADIATGIDTALGDVEADLTTHSTGANAVDAGAGGLHHSLGTGALQAATGNHNHNGVYAYDLNTGSSTGDASNVTITSTVSSAPTQIDSITFTLSQQTSVLLLAECSYDLSGTVYGNYVYTGFRVNDDPIANSVIVGGGSVPGGEKLVAQASVHLLTTLNSGSNTIKLCGYRYASSGTLTAIATVYRLTWVPIKAIS